MKINGALTFLINQEGLHLYLEDRDASIRILDLSLNPEDTVKLLSRLGHVSCDVTFTDRLDIIGKTMERKPISVVLPLGMNRYTDEDKIFELLKQECPEGWAVDIYLGLQNSFTYFTDNDGNHRTRVNTTIRRWV